MSGFVSDIDDAPFASVDDQAQSEFMRLMDRVESPGHNIDYQQAKLIYVYHPLGGKLAEGPITMAQSQPREIKIPNGPEELLIPAFEEEWSALGSIGADGIIKQIATLARVYGIAGIAAGNRNAPLDSPMTEDDILSDELFFNVLDPLNTAGSLILDQNPSSPNFMKPGAVTVNGTVIHPSRTIVLMNEQPLYLQWESSAFGFSGRSVFQRALFPLRTYLDIMKANQMIARKSGLLVAKMKSPTSAPNKMIQGIFGIKRRKLKMGKTGEVMGIGLDEDVQSIDLHNMEPVLRWANEKCSKDIAAADNMPAGLLEMETLTHGFGEGSEDAKQIARYIDRKRIELTPVYSFFDQIVMRRAWSESFYRGIQQAYPDEYGEVPYNTAFQMWRNSFKAVWPNLLTEPDSKKAEIERDKFSTVVALWAALSSTMDPENRANLAQWVADQINSSEKLFDSQLDFDREAMAEFMPDVSQEPHVNEVLKTTL